MCPRLQLSVTVIGSPLYPAPLTFRARSIRGLTHVFYGPHNNHPISGRWGQCTYELAVLMKGYLSKVIHQSEHPVKCKKIQDVALEKYISPTRNTHHVKEFSRYMFNFKLGDVSALTSPFAISFKLRHAQLKVVDWSKHPPQQPLIKCGSHPVPPI